MVNVFSFCIFGKKPKYCQGLLKNIEIIKEYFPDWEVWVYIGDEVPQWLEETLHNESNIKMIRTGKVGMENKVSRFFPIDSSDVDVCIVRDADSRIHARDRACIREFLDSDMKFHIVRDHPNHFHKIMAGMFGIKQGCLSYKIAEAYAWWKQQYSTDAFWDDTYFLVDVIYPDIKLLSLVHDEHFHHEFPYFKKPFQVAINDKNEFIGQVYDFDENGDEYIVHK